MSIKKKLIPFKCLPASWGLSGKSFHRAKAEYELDGYDLDVAISHIDYLENPLELKKELLSIDRKYKKITNEVFERAYNKLEELSLTEEEISSLDLDKVEEDYKSTKIGSSEYIRRKEIKKQVDLIDVDVDFKYNKINEKEHAKRKATVLDEPWVDVLGVEIDPKKLSAGGAFNLDWNDAFIEELRKNGYQGTTQSQVVHRWFDTLCVDIAVESGLLLEGEAPADIIKTNDLNDGRKEYI